VAHISNDVRDKQKLLISISTRRGNRKSPLSGIWMRLDVGWFRIDLIDDQGKPMIRNKHGCLRTRKEYPEMMFPVMRDETLNGSV
jgi:hypothetical protein